MSLYHAKKACQPGRRAAFIPVRRAGFHSVSAYPANRSLRPAKVCNHNDYIRLIWVDFGASSGLMEGAMNTSLVKSVPQGDFVEVSVLVQDWETKFQMLVSQKRPIKYDMYPMPNIPDEFKNRLTQQGYCDLILESDQWQHFLVPNSN